LKGERERDDAQSNYQAECVDRQQKPPRKRQHDNRCICGERQEALRGRGKRQEARGTYTHTHQGATHTHTHTHTHTLETLLQHSRLLLHGKTNAVYQHQRLVLVPHLRDVSIRQHTSAYASIRQHTSAYVSLRQHTSARRMLGMSIIDSHLRRTCVTHIEQDEDT